MVGRHVHARVTPPAAAVTHPDVITVLSHVASAVAAQPTLQPQPQPWFGALPTISAGVGGVGGGGALSPPAAPPSAAFAPQLQPVLAAAAAAAAATAPAQQAPAAAMAANVILPGEPLVFYTMSSPPVITASLQAPASMIPIMATAPTINGMALTSPFIPVSSNARVCNAIVYCR